MEATLIGMDAPKVPPTVKTAIGCGEQPEGYWVVLRYNNADDDFAAIGCDDEESQTRIFNSWRRLRNESPDGVRWVLTRDASPLRC